MTEYDKFLELPKEKQLKIINAGFEYFGRYGYKGANTEDIANKAGISKGALFYYFKNKESFYLYLHELILSILVDTFLSRISLTMLPAPNLHNTSCVLS